MRSSVLSAAALLLADSVTANPQRNGLGAAPPPAAAGAGAPSLAGLAGSLGFGANPSKGPQTSQYTSYQLEILAQGAAGQVPLVTTDPKLLEAQARSKLDPKSFAFVAGGAGEGTTLDANRAAFKQWRIVPKMLMDMGPRNLSVGLFGKTYPTPVLMAPIGFQHILHPDAEPGAAEAAASLGIPYIRSDNSHASAEDISKAIGNNADKWFQLYWQAPDMITTQKLQRAQQAGYTTLVVTLDAFVLGWRPMDLDQGYTPTNFPTNASGLLSGLMGAPGGGAAVRAEAEDPPSGLAGLMGPIASWERLAWLRTQWQGPILLKGIQHVDDAKRALSAPVDGIIVSNHGGRQLDGAVGSLEVLPEIVDAVAGKIPVLFDSGIRTGSDIIKALSLGAKAVLVGRPWAYGMGINGKAGVSTVMRGLLAELEINMKVAGLKSVSELNRGVLRKVVAA